MTNLPEQPLNVLVTGGARRIGRAIVVDLASHGFGVAIHCNRSREEGEALRQEIVDCGGRAVLLQADLTDSQAIAELIPSAERELGPLSILVNCASIFENDTAADFSWDTWDRHFAIHAKAPAMLARVFAERLAPGREGLVVNIVDERVLRPNPRYFTYFLSKAALWAATRTMAQALAPQVRVNAIGPGPTLPSKRQTDQDFAAQVEGLILQRGPGLDEFGATIRYLWQARSVTGQMIALDGGQHLAWRTPDVSGMEE
jgi:NAD(P)-dependent dehydrogenase (short-subunit alcohol dehydrogenase family)